MLGSRDVGVLVTLALVTGGCSSTRPTAGPRRDPLIMSHLTHSKDDPLYAGSESNPFSDDRDDPIKATVSRKPDSSDDSAIDVDFVGIGVARSSLGQKAQTRDYRRLSGRVTYRESPQPGWRLRYAPSFAGDQYGGELRLDGHARLSLLRHGDPVSVEGQVVESGPGIFHYRVDSLAVLSP
jgi:hypothetical protein